MRLAHLALAIRGFFVARGLWPLLFSWGCWPRRRVLAARVAMRAALFVGVFGANGRLPPRRWPGSES